MTRPTLRELALPGKRRELTGGRYGSLTVLAYAGFSKTRQQAAWLCRCDCGREKVIVGNSLTSGATKTCGCGARVGRKPRYGHARRSETLPEWAAWDSMLGRCLRRKSSGWKHYGGRGITVCERWKLYENFYADMGPRPTPDHSLDRIDNDGNYEPGNCRWATRSEQVNNRRVTRWVMLRGTRMAAADAARALGVTPRALKQRLRLGTAERLGVTDLRGVTEEKKR